MDQHVSGLLEVAALWLAERGRVRWAGVCIRCSDRGISQSLCLPRLNGTRRHRPSSVLCVFQHILHRWVWLKRRVGCSQGQVRLKGVCKKKTRRWVCSVCWEFTLTWPVLQGAVSGCRGRSASPWPRSSYSQVGWLRNRSCTKKYERRF